MTSRYLSLFLSNKDNMEVSFCFNEYYGQKVTEHYIEALI